jgi:hypothetical protein
MGANKVIAFRFVNVVHNRPTTSISYFTLEEVKEQNRKLSTTMYRWIPEKAIKAWIANNNR